MSLFNDLKLSRYVVASQQLPSDVGGICRVLMSTRSGRRIVVDENIWNSLQAGNFNLEDRDRTFLIEGGILIGTEVDELAEVLAENDRAARTTNNVYLAIQPTAMCQLGCHYCGQNHTNKQLSLEDEDAILLRAEQKLVDPRFECLDVSWFGGEPLLAIEQIERLSNRFIELCKSNNVRYAAKCITNGVRLTKDNFVKLRALKINYFEVTLDGDADWHDRRRAHKGGQTSFGIIFDNLTQIFSLPDYNFEIGLRCNVDLTNQDGVIPLLDRLAANGFANKFAKVYFAPIHSWGNDAHLATGETQDFSAKEIVWTVEAIRRGFNIGLIPDRKPIVCMAVRPEAELVDAYGNLFTCSEVSYVPAYETMKPASEFPENVWAIGSLKNGERPDSRGRLGRFNDEIRSQSVPCGKCEILPICGGSCPKMWLENLDPCPTVKYNLSARLTLAHLLRTRKLSAVPKPPEQEECNLDNILSES